MVSQSPRAFAKDETAATMVEFSLVITVLLTVVLGFVDFAFALYQYNSAAKAAQVGARLAAVSSPVAGNLSTLVSTLNAGIAAGTPSAAYDVTCNGATSSCSGGGSFSLPNLNRIVYGGDGVCGQPFTSRSRGICDIYPRIQPANVVIEYVSSGLGYAGRPFGPVPTISLRLQNLTYKFFFLGGLLNLTDLTMPPMTATATGEDLCTSGC